MKPAPPVTKILLPIILSDLLIVIPRLSNGSHTMTSYHISIGNFAKGLKYYEMSLIFALMRDLNLEQGSQKYTFKKQAEGRVAFQNRVIFDLTLKSKPNWAIIQVD